MGVAGALTQPEEAVMRGWHSVWGVNKGRVSTKSGVLTKGGDVAQGDGDN